MRFGKKGGQNDSVAKVRRGFALVAVISVMVLLMLVCLAILSLSTVEIRVTRTLDSQAEARANARMALMLAIGELQKAAGPDQRVTARAEIKPDVDPSKRFWTGVWDTRGWDPQDAEKRKFSGWIVSSPDILQSLDGQLSEDDVKNPLIGNDLVTLVGKGSVTSTDEQVKVRKMNVVRSGELAGNYAYWVGDEGIKASFRVPTMGEYPWNQAGMLGVAANSGISSLDLDQYDALSDEEKYAGGVARGSIGLPFNQPYLSKNHFHDVTAQSISLITDVRRGGARVDLSTAFELPLDEFNELEEFHAGLEDNDTNFYNQLGSVYKDARFYHADESPDIGYVCEIPYEGKDYLIANGVYDNNKEGILRGPSWDLLRNHSRIYKREWEEETWERSVSGVDENSFAARGSLPHSYSGQKTRNDDPAYRQKYYNDEYAYHISTGGLYSKVTFGNTSRIRPLHAPRGKISKGHVGQKRTVSRSPMLSPIAARVTFAIGLVKRPVMIGGVEDWTLSFSFDPYLTIVNPYNVPITFDSIGIWSSKFNPINGSIEYTDRDGIKRKASPKHWLSQNWFLRGTFTMRLDDGPYTMEPGEVRVISPKKAEPGKGYIDWVKALKGSYDYDELSGFYIDAVRQHFIDRGKRAGRDWLKDTRLIQPKPGTTIKINLIGKGVNNSKESVRLLVSLYHSKDHQGGSRDIFTHIPGNHIRMHGGEDILDQPCIANIGLSLHDRPAHQPNVGFQREFNADQIPQPGIDNGVGYLGVIDVKMKTTNEGFPTFSVNPRGGAFDFRDYDGSDRTSPQWEVELLDISDLMALQLVPGSDGRGYWGEGREISEGSKHTVLYELPQLPLTSLAQLQHLNTGVTGTSGALQIGNSFPHPGIEDLTKIVGQRESVSRGFSHAPNGSGRPITSQVLSDMAWATNENLWDRYFFSGINWGDAVAYRLGADQDYKTHKEAIDALVKSDRAREWPSQNPRIGLFSNNLTAQQKSELYDYDKIAKYLAVFGGFNVNSTSEKAWQAIFSALRKIALQYVDEKGDAQTAEVMNAFSRFMVPTTESGEAFGSFRDLYDEDIALLAEKMVEQVKARGPFMGLADFVNRRLTTEEVAGTDLGAVGALQAAIEAANINTGKWTQPPTAKNVENVSYKAGGVTRTLSTYAGTAGYLMQADILNSIGGIITARSDTFIVRAYGSSLNKNGEVIAEAWCEAIVQRTPEWYQSTDESVTRQSEDYPSWSNEEPVLNQWEQNSDFPAINKKMGRKFKIQSFRWLNVDEV